MNNLTSHISQPPHSYPTLPLSQTKELILLQYGQLRDRVEQRIRQLQNRLPSNQIDPTLTRATLRLPKQSYGLQYLQNPHQHHHRINQACKYCAMEKQYKTKIQARNLHSPSSSSNSSHKNGPMQTCPQVESMYALGQGYGLGHGQQREREQEREGNHVPLVEKLPLQSNRSNQNNSYPSSGTLNHRSGDSVLSINQALMQNLRVQKEMNNNLKALSDKLSDLSLRRSDSGSGYDQPGRQGLMNNQDPHINSHVNTHSHINTQSHPNLTNPFLNNRRQVQFHSNQHHGNFINEYNSHDYYYGQPFRKQYQFRERQQHIHGHIHSNKNNNNRKVYEQPRQRYFEENEEQHRNEKVYPRKVKNIEGRSQSYDGYMRYHQGSIEDKYKNMRNHCFYPNYQRNQRQNNSSKHSGSAQGRTKSVSVNSLSVAESRKKNNGLKGIKEISSPKKSKFSRTRNNNSSKDSQNENEIVQQHQSPHSRRKMQSEYFISRKRQYIQYDGGIRGIQANKISDYPNRDAQYRNKNHQKEHPMQAFSQQQKARKELLYKIGKNFDAAYEVK